MNPWVAFLIGVVVMFAAGVGVIWFSNDDDDDDDSGPTVHIHVFDGGRISVSSDGVKIER